VERVSGLLHFPARLNAPSTNIFSRDSFSFFALGLFLLPLFPHTSAARLNGAATFGDITVDIRIPGLPLPFLASLQALTLFRQVRTATSPYLLLFVFPPYEPLNRRCPLPSEEGTGIIVLIEQVVAITRSYDNDSSVRCVPRRIIPVPPHSRVPSMFSSPPLPFPRQQLIKPPDALTAATSSV